MMKNPDRNTVSVVYFLFCFFIITYYASATSFIRQFITDDLNTNMQQEERARSISNGKEEEVYYLPKHHEEISSRDSKVESSIAVGVRHRRPSTFSLKMESFNTLLNSKNVERYESRPFSVGGYNWTLIVYPNGNKNDNGAGYLSLYVAIDNSTLIYSSQEVYVDLKFYFYNNKHKTYFTAQDTDVWRFTGFKSMRGFSRVLSVKDFTDPNDGYLYDGDRCEFGVDVIIHSLFEKSELFSVNENIRTPTFTWRIMGFSRLVKDTYLSDAFSIGERSWNIRVSPSGHGKGEGKALSMYLVLNANEKLRPYEKIYVRAKLRVLNQRRPLRNIERQVDHWFADEKYRAYGSGYDEFISLADLRDPSEGFLVNDVLIVQSEFEAVSSTKYYPN